MDDRTRRWILLCGGLVTVAAIGAGAATVWGGGTEPDPIAHAATVPQPALYVQRFFASLGSGDADDAASVTDGADVALDVLRRTVNGMGEATVGAVVADQPAVAADTTTATVTADLTWTMPGRRTWAYPVQVELRRQPDRRRIPWTPTVLHPRLVDGQALAYTPLPGAGAVVDRDGTPIDQWGVRPAIVDEIRRSAGPLDGADGARVATVDAAGTPVEVLHDEATLPAGTMTATLSRPVQIAAQAAVDLRPTPAMIVALQPSTGEILAVAQNQAVSGTNPLVGRYPPGSTFKIVTAAAAMEEGLAGQNTALPCPESVTVKGRTVRNDGFGLGDVPLHTAFARSCNTTFARLGGDLPAESLPHGAARFGIGKDFAMPGATTNTGSVPRPDDDAKRVEASFGQGDVVVSPFGMALAAATVASGRAVSPMLLRGKETIGDSGPEPPSAPVVRALRAMMREVVTAGTATALGGLGQVAGKTGTAEYGTSGGSHGWFVGYRGDLAFAVLVQDAGSSDAAVEATAGFLSGF